mmetsp:Transcript_29970/g.95655  ORF Transcript_29970/g.95655 Transcript_29970/m.95655 type:complete len:361 (-) Transcript_29970:47-1129(-)
MADDGAFSFTIVQEGVKGKPAKVYTLRPGTNMAVRIGRAPGNDIVVEHRGASQYHAELRLLPDANGAQRLHVRDLSMNGTGLKRADGKVAECLTKNANEPISDGAELLVPMMLKASLTSSDRAWLKVEFQETPPASADASAAAQPRNVPVERQAPHAASNEQRTPKAEAGPAPPSRAPSPAPAAPAPQARDGSASEQEDKDAEKSRMQFVELLLKTREVSAGTTYEQARGLLSNSPAWHAVDEQTRRECFEIFVEHLGNHSGKKKGKKDKSKGKKEKRRHREDEEPQQKEPAAEAPRSKRRTEPERKGGSASPDRAHRKSKREKKGREKSRGRSGGGGHGSRSASRQQKKRRRSARSGSA